MEKIPMSTASMSRYAIRAYLMLYLENEKKKSGHKGLKESVNFLISITLYDLDERISSVWLKY